MNLKNLVEFQVGNVLERYRTSAKVCANLYMLLSQMPDPFPFLDRLRARNQEQERSMQILGEQLAESKQRNQEAKLKLADLETEITHYKQIVDNFESELSELKQKLEGKEARQAAAIALAESDEDELLPLEGDAASSSSKKRKLQEDSNSPPLPVLLRRRSLIHRQCYSQFSSSAAAAFTVDAVAAAATWTNSINNKNNRYTSTRTTRSSLQKSMASTVTNESSFSSGSSGETANSLSTTATASSDLANTIYLNTGQIARRTLQLLNEHKVPREHLAYTILGRSASYMRRLLNEPRPWEELTETKKSEYRKLLNWSIAYEENSN